MHRSQCSECDARVECLEKGFGPEGCLLDHKLFDSDHSTLYDLHITTPLVERQLSFEHRDCPSLPVPHELAMFKVIHTGDECIFLKCNRCQMEIIFWIFER